MKQALLTKSSEWTQKAIRSYLDGQYETFFVNAGIAFELLGKAFLAGIHPSLLVDKDFDSLLQVCGAGSHSKRAPGNIRTIGAKDVISRTSQVLPQLKSYEQELGFLADMRNGAVHIGVIGAVNVVEIASVYFRATKVLAENCGQIPDQYFSIHSETVKKLIDDSSREIEKVVTIKVARAKQVFEEKYGELEIKLVDEIAEIIRQSYILEEYYDEYETCPACLKISLSSGTYEVEWELADRDDETPEPIVRLNVERFICKICGLSLNGRDEIIAAKLQDKITIENVDVKFLFDLGFDYEYEGS